MPSILLFAIKIVEILNSTQAYNPLSIIIIHNYVHNGSSIQMSLSGVSDSKGYVKFSLTSSMKAMRQSEIFKTKHIFSNMIFER